MFAGWYFRFSTWLCLVEAGLARGLGACVFEGRVQFSEWVRNGLPIAHNCAGRPSHSVIQTAQFGGCPTLRTPKTSSKSQQLSLTSRDPQQPPTTVGNPHEPSSVSHSTTINSLQQSS